MNIVLRTSRVGYLLVAKRNSISLCCFNFFWFSVFDLFPRMLHSSSSSSVSLFFLSMYVKKKIISVEMTGKTKKKKTKVSPNEKFFNHRQCGATICCYFILFCFAFCVDRTQNNSTAFKNTLD